MILLRFIFFFLLAYLLAPIINRVLLLFSSKKSSNQTENEINNQDYKINIDKQNIEKADYEEIK